MNTYDLLVKPETDKEIVPSKMRKSLPWIIGAATVVAGTLLIRSWKRNAKEQENEEPEQQINTSNGIIFKSLATQLIPIAALFLKHWLKKGSSEKEALTA
jgi:hypothetical protein